MHICVLHYVCVYASISIYIYVYVCVCCAMSVDVHIFECMCMCVCIMCVYQSMLTALSIKDIFSFCHLNLYLVYDIWYSFLI